MASKNLSEELFKPQFNYPETSSLLCRGHHAGAAVSSALDGENRPGWYRMLNRLLWSWRGVPPQEIIEVLARIAASSAKRTSETLLDTVIGYRSGNWIYEWSRQAAGWQQQGVDTSDDVQAAEAWLHAANLYSLAGYPHIKGDELADQAQLLANRAYEEATKRLPGELKKLSFSIPEGSDIAGFLHLPSGSDSEAPFPTVLICGGLDALQSDYYRVFQRYLAPRGIAMLTIDMPSIGFSTKWTLNQDTSFLHQQVLRDLASVPWVDHSRVAALAYRFGANIAVRLAYLEPGRLRAVACLGPVVHSLLTDPDRQNAIPDMYSDVLASRLGMPNVSDQILQAEINRYSLRVQGLLGRRTSVPMLSAFWQNDLFSPEEESRLIVNSSVSGKLLTITPSPLMKNFDTALEQTTDWLMEQLHL